MFRESELLDMMMTATILRMDHGITQQEIDSMMPYQFELMKMMIMDILKQRAEK